MLELESQLESLREELRTSEARSALVPALEAELASLREEQAQRSASNRDEVLELESQLESLREELRTSEARIGVLRGDDTSLKTELVLQTNEAEATSVSGFGEGYVAAAAFGASVNRIHELELLLTSKDHLESRGMCLGVFAACVRI